MDDIPFVTGNSSESSISSHCNYAYTSPNNDESGSEILEFTSDATLSFLKRMLLEEEIDDIASTYEEEVSLRATVKSFYDIIGQDYPSSPDVYSLNVSDNQETYTGYHVREKSSTGGMRGLVENDLCCDVPTYKVHPLVSYGTASTVTVKSLHASTIHVESLIAEQIQKGAQEAMKFLPKISQLYTDIDEYNLPKINEETYVCDKEKTSFCYPMSRKSPNDDCTDLLDGRKNKQIALYSVEPERNEISDKVLLILDQKMKDVSLENNTKSSKSVIEHNEKLGGCVDVISLLICCSEAISTNDHKTAVEMIKRIKEHASPSGNWSERLAYYLVDGLEARLAGTGSEIYGKVVINQPSFSEYLKAYHLYVATCPHKTALIYFANQSIFNILKDVSEVHIINYGEILGFQWPSFFEHFSNWKSKIPKVRMTSIEVPERGFHPNKRLDSLGRRLAFYAKKFNVPLEYRGIASKWENIKPEDLNLSNDQLIIVNCLSSVGKVSDEATAGDSPRDTFLKTIRSIRPYIFIHGFDNVSYDSPFFATRFKSVVSHYSCLFDMIDTIMPRDNPERVRIERDLFIPYAINAIACEGSARIVRPETYKKWQRRHLDAGFVQVQLDPMVTKNMKGFVREHYHKEFAIEEENGWLLHTWKGRILYAQSVWKPNEV